MKRFFKNYYKSLCHIPYTFKHYVAVLKLQYRTLHKNQNIDTYVIKKLKECTGCASSIPFKFHDLDKLFMYLFFGFLGTRKIKEIHKILTKHHITDPNNIDFISLLEALFDWESAHYTKKDKGANAVYLIHTNRYNRSEKQINELSKIIKSLNELNPSIKIEPFIYEV